MFEFFKCMKDCKCTKFCVCVCVGGGGGGGVTEFIGNQGVQFEKLQWFEGVQLEKLQWFERGATFHHFHSHLYIYIYMYIIPNSPPHEWRMTSFENYA